MNPRFRETLPKVGTDPLWRWRTWSFTRIIRERNLILPPAPEVKGKAHHLEPSSTLIVTVVAVLLFLLVFPLSCYAQSGNPGAEVASKVIEGVIKDYLKEKSVSINNVVFNETETTLDFIISAGAVASDISEFFKEFNGDWWRGKLTLSAAAGNFTTESVSVTINLWHQAGIMRPHDTDELRGTTISESLILDSAGSPSSGEFSAKIGVPMSVPHRKVDSDKYSVNLKATVAVVPGLWTSKDNNLDMETQG